MNVVRCALLVPLLATFALTGCHTRGESKAVEQEELGAENQRLLADNERLIGANNALKAQLQTATDELGKHRASKTIGEDFRNLADGEKIEGVETTERGLALSEDFAFAKGSIELSAEGKRALEKIAERLKGSAHANGMVIVEGHTDKSPVARASTKEKYIDNWGLSGARAAAVIRALQAAGVEPRRIKGQFRGEYQPRGGDEAANRRVEIYLGN